MGVEERGTARSEEDVGTTAPGLLFHQVQDTRGLRRTEPVLDLLDDEVPSAAEEGGAEDE